MEPNQTSGALNVASNAALEAGKVIAQSIVHLDRVQSIQTDNADVLTDVDAFTEKTIIHHLDEAYPEFNIVGADSGDHGRESEFCWLIDPIDGTQNFIHGHPQCAVSIALKHTQSNSPEHKEEIIVAVVYDPFRNELFTARRGAGAQLDNRRIRVSDKSRLSDSLLCTDFPQRGSATSKAQTKIWLKSFAGVLPRAQSVHRSGSPVLDLAYVAAGRYDGFWEHDLNPCSIAAGSLLVREAGGLVTDLGGSSDVFLSGNLVAGTPKVHDKLSQLLNYST